MNVPFPGSEEALPAVPVALPYPPPPDDPPRSPLVPELLLFTSEQLAPIVIDVVALITRAWLAAAVRVVVPEQVNVVA
jgi:hypothetical protein